MKGHINELSRPANSLNRNYRNMFISEKIRKRIEAHDGIRQLLKSKNLDNRWGRFTRTHFNLVARYVNREVSREVIANPELVEMNLVIGTHNLQKQMQSLRCLNVQEFTGYLQNLNDYRVFNWVSGKTLQSYWKNGEAKYIKINALLVFLKVPFKDWDEWQQEQGKGNEQYTQSLSRMPARGSGFNRASLSIIKSYYLGNYFLYYQKTDGSPNIIKTAFVLKEHESGHIVVNSVSEGHRYSGKPLGIRDGCLYITCQNLDFEEMEQYVFNIGLETKPQVLFGVSTTVSVRNRQAVALKNILVKQKNSDPDFDQTPEMEIPFSKKYNSHTEEALVVQHLKKTADNIIITPSCCRLEDLKILTPGRNR